MRILSILFDIIFGLFLIVVGFKVVETRYDFALFVGSGAALVIWGIAKTTQKWEESRKKWYECLRCSHRFSWRERRAFSKPAPCSSCGIVLIYLKWPVWLSDFGVVLLPFGNYLIHIWSPEISLGATIALLGFLLIEVGIANLRLNLVDEPIEDLTKYPSIDEFNSAQFEEALNLLKGDDIPSALKLFEELHERTPYDPEVKYNLAVCHCDLGEEESAKRFLQGAVRLNPDFLEDAREDEDLVSLHDWLKSLSRAK